MSKFIQDGTGVVISVSDEKDERFDAGWKPVESESAKPERKPRAKK